MAYNAREKREDNGMRGSSGAEAGNSFGTPYPEQQVIRQEMISYIRKHIAKLPAKYRSVIILSHYGELTSVEIAERLSLSVETVEIRLHRARMKPREKLETGCMLHHDAQNEFVCDRKDCPIP